MFLALMKLYRAVQLASPFLVVADVAPNHPQKKCWKLAFRSMFLMGIKSQRFGVSSFSKFYYTLQKNPFYEPIASSLSGNVGARERRQPTSLIAATDPRKSPLAECI